MTTDSILDVCEILAFDKLSSALQARIAARRLNWHAIIFCADRFLLLPALAFAVIEKELQGLLPSEIKKLLNEVLRANRLRTQSMTTCTLETVEMLNRSGIIPLVLKGASYPFISGQLATGWRTTTDIDMLVTPSEAEEALSALRNHGYSADPNATICHHFPAMSSPAHPFAVELHVRYGGTVADYFLNRAGLRREEKDIGGRLFSVLDPTSTILFNIVHAELHHSAASLYLLQLHRIHDYAALCRHLQERTSLEAVRAAFQQMNVAGLYDRYYGLSQLLFRWNGSTDARVASASAARRELWLRKARLTPWWRTVLTPLVKVRWHFCRLRIASSYGCATNGVSLWVGYCQKAVWLAGQVVGRSFDAIKAAFTT